MKKLFPILMILLALFASPLIGQDTEQPTDAPNTEESAKTSDEEVPSKIESEDATEESDELTEEEAAKAAEDKAKAEAWLEGQSLAGEYSSLDDDDKRKEDYAIDGFVVSGDTAWMIVATALVLMMTIPGLSLFYGGLARRKNVLSVLVQCFACTALMTLLWTIYGYSVASSGDGQFFGDFAKVCLKGCLLYTSPSPRDS